MTFPIAGVPAAAATAPAWDPAGARPGGLEADLVAGREKAHADALAAA